MRAFLLLPATLLLVSCGERSLRASFANLRTGKLELPAGAIELHHELTLPEGARDVIIVGKASTLLRAAADFRGRGLIAGENVRNIRVSHVQFDGNRTALGQPREMLPPENAYRLHYQANGLWFDQTEGLEVNACGFREFAAFPILVSRSRRVRISGVTVEDSGSRDPRGRNNTTGGILLEEGTADFAVTQSRFARILGNALWTHSLFTSPRLAGGRFAYNRFENIGRDAIQIGHATRVVVEENSGAYIGYPHEIVDIEHDGTPVAVDTAGNVDQTVYRNNRFEELNGKCFDLDGFHHGEVSGNTCVNRQPAEAYPAGHFAVVLNNNDPNMKSEAIRIVNNTFDGTKFGGIFLIGRDHEVSGNILRRLNLARCTEEAAKFGCYYLTDEPDLLRAGIYIGRGVKRLEDTGGNVIRGNRISGWKMDQRCIVAAPGLALGANRIEGNVCVAE